jgi:uncharacterized membrane protein
MSDANVSADLAKDDSASTLARAGVIFCRVVQFVLVALAALFVIGSLMAGVNVIAFAAIGVFALVLLGFAGVVEGVVRLIRGRSG